MTVGALGLSSGSHHTSDTARASGSTTAQPTMTGSGPVLAKPEPGSPRLVRVPVLGISARVVPIRDSNDTLVPPSDPHQVGWWADGARPGATEGSALLTGHTVHTGGGALDDLETMRSGDKVVVRTDHDTLRYVVQRVRIYDKGALARHASDLFRQDGSPRLVLVTCEDWNGDRFLSNVVVTATRGT
ncbi:MAG TPA: class F sortase [Nocardioides sp.]|nr:class F sortase [Nocardioides sp.]